MMGDREQQRPWSVADREALQHLIERARLLLGDSFDALRCSYLRRSREATSAEKLHPLMALVQATGRSIDSLETSRPLIYGFQILQLDEALNELEAWRDHPIWPEIAGSIKTPTAFDHAVLALATASQLGLFGNKVRLLPAESLRGGHPDFWIAALPEHQIVVEVKTPRRLQRRSQPLSQSEGAEIVRRSLHKAGTGIDGQLRLGSPALLVIGGIHLGQANCEALKRGANDFLAAEGALRPHLYGVLCVSMGVAGQNLTIHREEGVIHAATSAGGYLHAILTLGMAPNYSYTGNAPLSNYLKSGIECASG